MTALPHARRFGLRFDITLHAVQRYAERIKHVPDMRMSEKMLYGKDMAALIERHAELHYDRPDWLQPPADEPEGVQRTACWLIVGDSIAFPVVTRDRKQYIVTVLTKGELSHEKRALRNEIKARKRKSAASKRAEKAWRGEKAPRWR